MKLKNNIIPMANLADKVVFFSKKEDSEELNQLAGEVTAVNEDGTVNLSVTLDSSENKKDFENVKVLGEEEAPADGACKLVPATE